MRRSSCLILGLATLVSLPATAAESPPSKPTNLKYFPKDIAREALIQRMREFSFALGVRCQYCHAGGDGVSFDGVVFSSDEKPAKIKARAMLRMVDALNNKYLAGLPARHRPPARMDCVICHRGLPVPKTLATELTEVIAAKGTKAAVERYRELRARTMPLGRYNFDEWTMNELARSLAVGGNSEAAIAMLEINGEFYPSSPDIEFQLGELHRTRGEREKAMARYRAALEKKPTFVQARQRLSELETAR